MGGKKIRVLAHDHIHIGHLSRLYIRKRMYTDECKWAFGTIAFVQVDFQLIYQRHQHEIYQQFSTFFPHIRTKRELNKNGFEFFMQTCRVGQSFIYRMISCIGFLSNLKNRKIEKKVKNKSNIILFVSHQCQH